MATTSQKAPRPRVAPSENAKALYRFLQTQWDDMGIAPTAWCRKHGIPDPTVLRWRQGIEPDVRNLRRIAEALGRSLLDILIAAEYITPEEANGHVPVPMVKDARTAILNDPAIDDVLAQAMLSMWDSWDKIIAGSAEKIVSETRATPRGPRTRTAATIKAAEAVAGRRRPAKTA